MADYRKSSVHCHSTLCDGKNTLQEMAGAACAQGLTTLGFSGHSYTKPDREYCMTPGRTAQYRATIAKLKNEYRGKVDILCGIEWDLLSEGTPKGFDYWIGSAHHLYGKNTGKYYEIDFRPEDLRDCINNDFDGDPLAAVEAYFAEVEKIAAKKPDILGHIDLVKKLNADGVILFCHWGCKQTMGLSTLAKRRLEEAGLPTLVLDGDGCDSRNVADGQMVTRVGAFLEQLEGMDA